MIYPELETFRRDSCPFEVLPDFRPSQPEKNYNQIFVKGPALTKDFLVKMNSEIVPKKTCLFGYELNTKKILLICGLFLLFFTSLFGAGLMWFTDFFDNTVLSTMVISNSSKNLHLWTNPSPKALNKFYIFNYTNLEQFNKGLEKKLKVAELGPYVYAETIEKVNVQFSDDGNTVSYQDKRTFKFLPGLSKGRQSDQVTVPNIPVIGGAAITKYQNYFARLAFSSFLSGMDEEPFVKVPADQFIIGYRNRLLDLSQTIMSFNGVDMHAVKKVGLLSARAGVQPHVITMNTGKMDINKLGLIEKLDGKELFDYWSTEECNRLSAADGGLYPPKLVQKKQPLRYMIPQVCRTLPLVYQREENILDGKIPAYRYTAPDEVYDTAEENPENQCYCSMSSGECPLKGVFNITPCNFGVPLFVSKPHFYGADPILLKGVEGLKALKKKDVETYLDIHPTMGFLMSGRSMFQLNIQIKKAFGMHQFDRFDDGLILPIAFVKVELNEKNHPDDFLDLIYDATYTLKGVKLAFKYGFLLTTFITLVCLVLVFKYSWERPNRIGGTRSLQRQTTESTEI